MRSSYCVTPRDHDQACRILEALCEGYVQAMLVELGGSPEDTFPCCIKCGGFRTRNTTLTPAQTESLEEALERGHPVAGLHRHALSEIVTLHGGDPDEQQRGPASTYWEDPAAYRRSAAIAARNTLPDVNWTPDGSIPVRGVADIVRNQGGNTVELACYQCANKRHENADPGAKVIIVCTVPGTYRGVVLMSEQHIKPEKRGRIDDPIVDARPLGACGCEWGADAPQ